MKNIFISAAVLSLLAFTFIGLSPAGAEEARLIVSNRMASASVGEWVIYNIPGEYMQKHTVIEKTGQGSEAQITIRVESIYEGEVVHTQEYEELTGEETFDLPSLEGQGMRTAMRTEVIYVKDRDLDAQAIDVFKNGELLRTWYLSKDIPVYGLVKRVTLEGSPGFEVVDYGVE